MTSKLLLAIRFFIKQKIKELPPIWTYFGLVIITRYWFFDFLNTHFPRNMIQEPEMALSFFWIIGPFLLLLAGILSAMLLYTLYIGTIAIIHWLKENWTTANERAENEIKKRR